MGSTTEEAAKRVTSGIGPSQVFGYAELTGDFNPIHVDPVHASKTRFGRPIVHGTFVLAELWPVLQRRFGARALQGMEVTVEFRRPVHVGDSVRVSLEDGDGPDPLVAPVGFSIERSDGTPAIVGTIRRPSQ